MANITIHIGSHGGDMTVSEMRKKLAKVLSKLRGDQSVTFAFGASLQNYVPQPPARSARPALVEGVHIIRGELAAPENN